MANLRSLLLIASALGVLVNLSSCTVPRGSEKLLSTPPDSTVQLDTKVRRHGKVRLDFHEQKPGTETQLQVEQQIRQELLEKQAELKQSGNQTTSSTKRISEGTATNEAALKRSDAAIAFLFEKAVLTEKNLTEAYAEPTSNSNAASVGLKFDADGSKTFAKLTKKLAGTGRFLGIFLNGRLVSSPAISSEFAQTGITGGTAVIAGKFSAQEAKSLAANLRGDLPKVSSEQSPKN